MRRKPILSVLLAAAILGGMLWLFPHLWMLLVLIVLVLVTTQVILVRRHLFTLPAGRTEMAMPASPSHSTTPEMRPESSPATTETEAKAERIADAFVEESPSPDAPATEPAEAAEPGEKRNAGSTGTTGSAGSSGTPAESSEDAATPVIDRTVFSRFREHLSRAEEEERARPPGTIRRTPGTVPADEGEVEDLVEISSQGRRPPHQEPGGKKPAEGTPPGSPPSPAPAPVEEEGPDLFADLRPPPPAAKRSREESGETEAGPPPGEQDAPEQEAAPQATSRATPRALPQGGEPDAPLPGANEKPPGLEDEAGALLHLAEEAAERGNWEEARAGLENYLAHLAAQPELIHWRARQLEVKMALRGNDANRALQGFEAMLESGYQPAVEGVPSLLENLLAGAGEGEAGNLRVSMLVRLLAVFRQGRDQGAMDLVYGWIEQAQEKAGDERKLIQYLKNHLEIRKAMGNVSGQLELIDQLGNRCYKLGLTEDAKHYYEMGLKLKGEKGEDGTDSPEAVPS